MRNTTFMTQPSRRYRNFQLAFGTFTVAFTLSAFSYTFLPNVVMDSFLDINRMLGGVPYEFPDRESYFWRYLGAGNVWALALCCLLLQLNLKRFYPVIYPLWLMKGFVAVSWFIVWFNHADVYFFGVAASLDLLTLFIFLYFGPRAYRAISERPDLPLVPKLWEP